MWYLYVSKVIANTKVGSYANNALIEDETEHAKDHKDHLIMIHFLMSNDNKQLRNWPPKSLNVDDQNFEIIKLINCLKKIVKNWKNKVKINIW